MFKRRSSPPKAYGEEDFAQEFFSPEEMQMLAEEERQRPWVQDFFKWHLHPRPAQDRLSRTSPENFYILTVVTNWGWSIDLNVAGRQHKWKPLLTSPSEVQEFQQAKTTEEAVEMMLAASGVDALTAMWWTNNFMDAVSAFAEKLTFDEANAQAKNQSTLTRTAAECIVLRSQIIRGIADRAHYAVVKARLS